MIRWLIVGGVLVVFAGVAVMDWLDGPVSQPDSELVYALLVFSGLALGWRPPWSGKGD